MMRGLVLGGIAFAAVFALERQFEKIAEDLKRYDRLRAMSGDPPFLRSQLAGLTKAAASFSASRTGDALGLFQSLQNDLVRYAKLKGM